MVNRGLLAHTGSRKGHGSPGWIPPAGGWCVTPPHPTPHLPTGEICHPPHPHPTHTSSWPRFSTSFAYYGLAMDLQNFDFNIYVIQLIFGAVDIPAKLVSILTITFVGRRFTQAVALILAGLAILANILVPRGEGWGGVVVVATVAPSSPTHKAPSGRAKTRSTH